MIQTPNPCPFCTKAINKIYPIIKRFEEFWVNEISDKRLDVGIKGKFSMKEQDKLKKRLDEQEEMIITRAEEITKDEALNLENLLGFINQRKLYSYLNISNIMRLNKLDFTDLYYTRDLDLMLVRKTLLEKVNFI
jgi:hypothetical protein